MWVRFPGNTCADKKKCITCESLWIKASAKCVNVKCSLVSHTQNLCSALHPSKCTHPEQWPTIFLLCCPGSSWGFGAFLKSLTSVAVLRVDESTVRGLPPTYNHCRYWDSNPWPLGYKSDSLTQCFPNLSRRPPALHMLYISLIRHTQCMSCSLY